jgi:16S rRNA (cytidine1402-2'-O)-methyltransferase
MQHSSHNSSVDRKLASSSLGRTPAPTVALRPCILHEGPVGQPAYNRRVAGQLFLIGTPLGNLGDLSPRAVDTLRSLDWLYCEDTRHTAKLLAHFGISVPTRALSDDAPLERWSEPARLALEGRHVGYASDAGMPGIADPGRRLVRGALQAGIAPVVIPGPSAVTTLAAACPFIDAAFCFHGFVPRKTGDRANLVQTLLAAAHPGICFESPRRVHAFLDELCAALEPERELLLGRELTKLHEQVEYFRAAQWPERRGSVPELGECTLAVAAAPPRAVSVDEAAAEVALGRLAAAGFSRRDGLKALAAVWDVPLNTLKRAGYKP